MTNHYGAGACRDLLKINAQARSDMTVGASRDILRPVGRSLGAGMILSNDIGGARRMQAINGKIILALCIAAWFILYGFFLPPSLGGTDTYFFKDAGANLALGHGFTSVLTFGNPTFTPQIYTHYPPIYGLLFAAFSVLFGIGPLQDTLYNLATATLAAWFAFLVLSRRKQGEGMGAYEIAILALTCLSVPTGFYGADVERPDALGLAAALGALLVLSDRPAASKYFLAFLVAGLAFEISPVCGVLAVAGLGTSWLSHRTHMDANKVPLWRLVALSVASFCVVPVLVQGTTMAFDPTTARRLVGVILGTDTQRNTGGGYLLALLQGDLRTFLSAYGIATYEQAAQYAKLAIVAAAILGYSAWRIVATRSWRGIEGILPVLAVGILPVILVPYQSNYAGIAAGFILMLFATVVDPPDQRTGGATRLAIVLAYAGIFLVSAPTLVRTLLVQAQLGPSFQRMTETLTRLKNEPEFQGKMIAVPPEKYLLFKQMGFNVVNWYTPYLSAEVRQQIPLYALSYTGTGNPMQPGYPPWWVAKDYKVLFEPQLPQIPTMFGFPLSHSSVTWEVSIYEAQHSEAD